MDRGQEIAAHRLDMPKSNEAPDDKARAALIAERDDARHEAEQWRLRVNSDMRVAPPLRSRQLVFLHLMKCGGTSIQAALGEMMPGVPLLSVDETHFDAMEADSLSAFGLLMGHFSYDHIAKFRRPFVVTFLREPVERVVSMYDYLRSQPNLADNAAPVAAAHRMTLAEWVCSDLPECVVYVRNTQSQALATDWRSPRTMPDDRLAELALVNLGTFGFVGFLESIEADLMRLANQLEAEPPRALPHEKRASKPSSITSLDADVISLIERYNQADIAVYREARARWGGTGSTSHVVHQLAGGTLQAHPSETLKFIELQARREEVAALRGKMVERDREIESMLSEISIENNALRIELGRLQAQIIGDLATESSADRQPANLSDAATTAVAALAAADDSAKLAGEVLSNTAEPSFSETFEKVVSENHEIRIELGRLQAQIQAEHQVLGMPLQRFIDRSRAYTEVPPSQRSRQVAFLQMDKGAGTFVHHFLQAAMPCVPTFYGTPDLFDSMEPESVGDYGLVLGHFSYVHLQKLRHPLFLLTFLQDPVEQVLSSYFYLRQSTFIDDRDSATMMAKRLSLSDFLDCEHPSVTQFTMNQQCHALVSDWRGPRRLDQEQLAHEAMSNLESFDFVGFVDQIEVDIERLSQALDLQMAAQERYQDPTEDCLQRSAIDPIVISRIESLNQGDFSLYWKARRRFAAYTR